MSLSVKYNDDGSVTVECGDESVNIPPRGGRSAASGASSTKRRSTKGSDETGPATGPVIGPVIGPRVMIRLPGMSRGSTFGSTIDLKTFLSQKKHAALDPTDELNITMEPKGTIDVKKLIDQARLFGVDSEVHLWMSDIKPKK